MLLQRQYFGGGSRAALMVEGLNIPHKILHEALEDGTCPFHTIMALGFAIGVYHRLLGSQADVARHASDNSLGHTDRRVVQSWWSAKIQ